MIQDVKTNEPDCLQYTLHQGIEDKTSFFFYERYTNQDAIDLHTSTTYFKELMATIESLLANPPQIEFLEVVE